MYLPFMPVTVKKASDLNRTRHRRGILDTLPEWGETVRLLENGLKSEQGLEVNIDLTDKSPSLRQFFIRKLKAYLTEQQLPYSVESFLRGKVLTVNIVPKKKR